MQNSQVKVEGFDELFKTMDELAEEIGKGKTDKIWRKALGYAFEPVLNDAKESAPVDTGQLRDHIYLKVQRPAARDKASASYKGEMFMVRVTVGPKREDSVERTVLNKKGKFQTVFQNRPVALASEFGTAHEAARPFIRPALEKNVDNIIQRLGQAIWYELQWGKWTQGKGK
jgi:HK97 gp10 family phage protein